MADLIKTYLRALNEFPNNLYVNEQKATELIRTFNYQLSIDELLESFPADTRVGKLIREQRND